jgi:hypothetical protein
MVSAQDLKPGDCLHTAAGKRLVQSVEVREAVAGDNTVTVVLQGGADMLVVGGVVTHAKPEHGKIPASKARSVAHLLASSKAAILATKAAFEGRSKALRGSA